MGNKEQEEREREKDKQKEREAKEKYDQQADETRYEETVDDSDDSRSER